MALTLKQIVTRLETLALSHRQINHFFIGSADEFLDSSDVTYPACFCELNNNSNISLTDCKWNFNFTFHFFDQMDIANNSLQNEWEVKSDMVAVAQDYIAMLNYTGYQEDWEIGMDYQMQIRDYQLQDLVAGVSIGVTIGVRYDANRCQVPADDVEFENDTSMKIITNYIHTVTTEATSVTIASMVNKEILMLWLGDKLLAPVASNPTVDQYTYNATTGNFGFGTTTQIDQIIQILNRPL